MMSLMPSGPTPIKLFTSYAFADEALRLELEKHLGALKQEGLIDDADHARVRPGEEWTSSIAASIDGASIVLALVSADYISSKSSYDTELRRAIERHARGEARVIPIILRSCDWKTSLLGRLRPLPSDGMAITAWPDRDAAFANVATELRSVIGAMNHSESVPSLTNKEPRYPDAATRALSQQLKDAYARRDRFVERGMNNEAERGLPEIIAIKRQLRDGGQLRSGDSLGDGRYLLVDEIGRGGFGTVWKAHDSKLDRFVAIKVLHPNLAGDAIKFERFFRGARKMHELGHPHIVPVLEKEGREDRFNYFVMAFFPRGDLRRAVLSGGLGVERVIPLILQVGEALSSAHRLGIVHRDVKPTNILLDNLGGPRLTDFDLVYAPDTTGGTRTGPLGSYIYSPPEMLDRPQEADARADVYGLGMTTLFCLHQADLPSAAIEDRSRFMRKVVPDADLRKVLRTAIDKKSKRYADADEFCSALHAAYYPPLHVGGEGDVADERKEKLNAELEAAKDNPAEEDRLLREVFARARAKHGLDRG